MEHEISTMKSSLESNKNFSEENIQKLEESQKENASLSVNLQLLKTEHSSMSKSLKIMGTTMANLESEKSNIEIELKRLQTKMSFQTSKN